MTGTELQRQQRADAPTTALEKPLPGSLFPFVLWFKPAGVCLWPRNPGRTRHGSEWPNQLPVDLASLSRNPAIPWKKKKKTHQVFWGSSPPEKGSSRNSLVGHSSRKASLGEEGKASSRTHQAFTHLHCTLSSEGICHYITSHGVTCKKHLPSSLFRQGASQCRPMLPRANSAIEKKKPTNYYPSVELQALASLPSPALHCSRAQHPSWANYDRGWQPAVLLKGGSPAPTVGQGAAPSATLFIHPPKHHTVGPQSQLIALWGYRGILPTRQPHTHLIPKL